MQQMRDAATQRTSGPNTVLLDMDLQFGLGFFVPSSMMELGRPTVVRPRRHGRLARLGRPDAEMAFGYVMNKMAQAIAGTCAARRSINACYDSVGA